MSAIDRVKQIPRVLSRYRAILVPVAVLTLIGLYVALAHGDIDRVAHAVIRADPRWVAAAIVCQFAVLICITGNYRLLLGRLGHRVSWPVLLRAHLRRFAVATLVPFGSPASYVLFVRDLSSVGVSGTDAMSAVLLYSAGGQAAFVLFTIGASAWLMLSADLSVNPIALAIALPVTLTWVALPFLALHSGTARIASWKYMPGRVSRMMEQLAAHDLSPRDLLTPMLLSLFVNIAGLGMLIASLHAVGQQPTLSGLLLARLAGQLAAHAIPVMQGAGVVELSLAGSLQQTGVAMSTATAAALLFRLAQFWLPLTLGIVLLVNFRRALRPRSELGGYASAAVQWVRRTSAVSISAVKWRCGLARRAVQD